MPLHRTAQGKMIDMSSIVAKNEKVRAVGNMNFNARGVILERKKKFIKENTKRVKASYQKIIAQAPTKPAAQAPQTIAPAKKSMIEPDEPLTNEEKQLFDDDEDFEK